MALPPEKIDSLGSGDEKRMEKLSEPSQASKKQLKFEVSFLLRAVTLRWCSRRGKLRPIQTGGALTSYVDNCFRGSSFLLPLGHDTSAMASPHERPVHITRPLRRVSAHGEIGLSSLGLLPSYGIFRVLKSPFSPPEADLGHNGGLLWCVRS